MNFWKYSKEYEEEYIISPKLFFKRYLCFGHWYCKELYILRINKYYLLRFHWHTGWNDAGEITSKQYPFFRLRVVQIFNQTIRLPFLRYYIA